MKRNMQHFARQVFAVHGIHGEPERLGGGWTNEVFAAGGLVLRCTANTASGRLRREMQLARLLPAEVGYPAVVDSGHTDDCDWMLCQRIPGSNLEDAWAELSWTERADALEQLWQRARCVHALDAEAVRPYMNGHLWYFTSADNALAEAGLLRERALLTAAQHEALSDFIHRFEAAMAGAPRVPVHGDLTPANAMWHEGQITALMDFECATLAPKEADLMMLLNTAFERADLPEAAPDPSGEQRFHARMQALVQAENPNWDILQGYEAIKLTHHVVMDADDEDFSPEHDELVSLLALLADRRGRLDAVLPCPRTEVDP